MKQGKKNNPFETLNEINVYTGRRGIKKESVQVEVSGKSVTVRVCGRNGSTHNLDRGHGRYERG